MRQSNRLRLVGEQVLSQALEKRRLHWVLRVSAILILLSLFVLGTAGFTMFALHAIME